MDKLFNPVKCLVPTAWCGKGPVPSQKQDLTKNVKYVREGTKDECLQKGFGAGVFSEKAKGISSSSLQNIKYVGETYELNFRKAGITNLNELLSAAKNSSKSRVQSLVSQSVTKKGGQIDSRAYNHVLLWMYQNGVPQVNLPLCHEITE